MKSIALLLAMCALWFFVRPSESTAATLVTTVTIPGDKTLGYCDCTVRLDQKWFRQPGNGRSGSFAQADDQNVVFARMTISAVFDPNGSLGAQDEQLLKLKKMKMPILSQ